MTKDTAMKTTFGACAGALLAASVAFTPGAWAQKPIAYPAKGQSQGQQTKDDGECYVWAKQNTGIDPAAPPAPPAAPPPPQGERARGALRGAAAGAVIGEVSGGSASRGAGTGAAIGVVAGGARQRQNAAAAQQQSAAQQQGAIDTYYRAYGACMSGRGYTLK
jgi:hypothetical protein